jgi:hypothetical protein
MSRYLYLSQAVLQMVVGLGAVVSGMLLIAAPSGELLRAPPDMLKGSPFTDFLLPGIILVLVNGIGQIAASVMTIRRNESAGYAGAVFGMGLMIWIFVQVNMIGGGHILQVGYFFIGVVETALSYLIHDDLLKRKQRAGSGREAGVPERNRK